MVTIVIIAVIIANISVVVIAAIIIIIVFITARRLSGREAGTCFQIPGIPGSRSNVLSKQLVSPLPLLIWPNAYCIVMIDGDGDDAEGNDDDCDGRGESIELCLCDFTGRNILTTVDIFLLLALN